MLDNLAIKGYREYVAGVGTADSQLMDWQPHSSNKGYNCHYAFINEDGRLRRVAYHTCFGRLNSFYSYFPNETPNTLLVQVNTEFLTHLGVSKKMLTTYFKWLFEVSPLMHAFLNTYQEAVNDGVVAIDANAESGLIGNACSAVRLIWEHWYYEYKLPSIVKLWYDVVSQHDVDPTIAFAFCNNVQEKAGMFTLRGSTAGHQFLPVADSQALINFIDGNMTNTSIFSLVRNIEGINDVWYTPTGNKFQHRDLNEWMKTRFLGNTKQVNVFMPGRHSLNFTKEQAVAGIIQCVNDYQQMRNV